MNSFKNFSIKNLSLVMIAAALILSPVAKAGDEPVTNDQAMKAAPAVANNPTTTDSPEGTKDKTLLAKPAPTKTEMANASKCDGGKTCKANHCPCKSKKHCKYCKGHAKDTAVTDEPAHDAGDAGDAKANAH